MPSLNENGRTVQIYKSRCAREILVFEALYIRHTKMIEAIYYDEYKQTSVLQTRVTFQHRETSK